MHLDVSGRSAFAHTGGLEPDETPSGRASIVLIHGAGQHHSVWAYQTRLLAAKGISTYALDMPGHGRSEGPALTSIGDMAHWLDQFLDAAGIVRALVVGHSMGSFVAIELAAGGCDRVVGLVLTGTTDRMSVHPDLLEAAATGDSLATDLVTGWTHAGIDRFGGNPSPGLWSRGLTSRLLDLTLDGPLSASLVAVRSYEPAARAADVSVPVTVVVAADDRMARPEGAIRLVESFASATLVEIAGGHGGMLDHPRQVAGVIMDAYASVSDGFS